MKKNNSSDLLKDAALRLDESRPKAPRFVMLDRHAGDLAELMEKKLPLRVICKALEEVGIKISPPWLRLYLMTNFSEKYEKNYSSRYRRGDGLKKEKRKGEDGVGTKVLDVGGLNETHLSDKSTTLNQHKRTDSGFLVKRFLDEKMVNKKTLESKNDSEE